MKKQILVGLIAAVMFLFCNYVAVSNSYGADPLPKRNGTFCWNIADNDGFLGTLNLRISNIGDGHYLCSGIFNVTAESVFHVPAYGNVEHVEDKIQITLSYAGVNPDGIMMPIMIKIIIDPATLNGTYDSFGVEVDNIHLSGGTVSHTTCK